MNQLSLEKRCNIVAHLVEGASIRTTCRLCNVSKNTVLKLLVDLWPICQALHDQLVVRLQTKILQCDEIWAFIGCKAKNVPEHLQGTLGVGDVCSAVQWPITVPAAASGL